MIDVIGQIGVDPGTGWGTSPTSTENATLRRKSSIFDGDVNPYDAFDPSIEWNGFAQDTFSGLGTHSVAAPVPFPPRYSCWVAGWWGWSALEGGG